jgi:serine/threonine protein kinase
MAGPQDTLVPEEEPASGIPPRPLPAGLIAVAHLGRGGMAEIIGVRDRSGRPLALKRLHRGLEHHPRVLAAFQNEVAVLSTLAHPNIPHVEARGVERDGQVWFTMPWLRAWPLSRQLPAHGGEPRSLMEAWKLTAIVASAARALGSAHAWGFVHNDVRPENLLVDDAGQAFVIDWSATKNWSPGTRPPPRDQLSGAPGWMAPEQALPGSKPITPATDVWALGCLLHAILLGRPPHGFADPLRCVSEAAEARPVGDPPSGMLRWQRGLWRLMAPALHPDPKLRYPTAAALADVVERWRVRTARSVEAEDADPIVPTDPFGFLPNPPRRGP